MVQSVVDPVRLPTINLSPAELEEIQEMIEAGTLPKDFLERHYEAVEKNVFGADHKKDRNGEPIEQGLGSSVNQTRNSVEAYRKYGKDELGYEDNLKRLESELVKCDEARKSKVRVAAPAKKGRKS